MSYGEENDFTDPSANDTAMPKEVEVGILNGGYAAGSVALANVVDPTVNWIPVGLGICKATIPVPVTLLPHTSQLATTTRSQREVAPGNTVIIGRCCASVDTPMKLFEDETDARSVTSKYVPSSKFAYTTTLAVFPSALRCS